MDINMVLYLLNIWTIGGLAVLGLITAATNTLHGALLATTASRAAQK